MSVLDAWNDVSSAVRAQIIADAFSGLGRKEDHPGAAEWYEAIRSNVASQGARVPEGWVLVPKEPTDEMLNAAHAVPRCEAKDGTSCGYIAVYRSMLSAAPPAPSAPSREPMTEVELREVLAKELLAEGYKRDAEYVLAGDHPANVGEHFMRAILAAMKRAALHSALGQEKG